MLAVLSGFLVEYPFKGFDPSGEVASLKLANYFRFGEGVVIELLRFLKLGFLGL